MANNTTVRLVPGRVYTAICTEDSIDQDCTLEFVKPGADGMFAIYANILMTGGQSFDFIAPDRVAYVGANIKVVAKGVTLGE